MKSGDTIDLAYRSIRKHYELKGSFDLYQGIVSLYGLARLVVDAGADQYLDELKRELMPYVRDERRFKSNFPNYFCGGVATPYLLWKGLLPEAEGIVRHYAEEVMNDAPRDPAGILCHPRHPGESRIWVDVAFAVGPFMLFAGLALNDERYLSESYAQTAKMYKVLRDPENGLMHQSRGFRGADFISEDHWSRGNGWMAFALTELLHYLPEDHPDREAAVALYLEHTLACAQYQGDDGMWRQEMTEVHLSYVETSGTALLLYAQGVGVEMGVLDSSYRERFERGVRSFLRYVSDDLDVYHTCYGCLCPGEGTKLDYMAHRTVVNDDHAFGPLAMLMGQASVLGMSHVTVQ